MKNGAAFLFSRVARLKDPGFDRAEDAVLFSLQDGFYRHKENIHIRPK